MENRRRHYRHPFAPSNRLKVQLKSTDKAISIETAIVNLSIGGMYLEAAQPEAAHNDRWTAVFRLHEDAPPIKIAVEKVYDHLDQAVGLGLRFIPPDNLNQRDEQEKAIWRFLLEEQWNDRRIQRESARRAGVLQ
jgi:hypothetical protein